MANMWTLAALFLLLCSAEAAAPAGAPALAPIVATTKSIIASAPAVARSFGASIVGPSDTCRIPASGGMLINAPLDKGNPMASNIQPYVEPPSHSAHADSAGLVWQDLGLEESDINAASQAVFGGFVPAGPFVDQYGTLIEDASLAISALPGTPDAAPSGDAATAAQVVRQVGADILKKQPQYISDLVTAGGVGAGVISDIAEYLDLGSFALKKSAKANSAPLDLQDAEVANSDASTKTVQGKGINNPATLAVQAGKPVSAAAQAPLTAFQNILVLAPQQAAAAKAPSVLPSALQAGAAAPVQPAATGGRKMLATYPDCCNTYTVKPGDTLASIAAAYGQPTNGVTFLQAINGLPSTTVAPGQSIMLPCGRVLSYFTAYNAGLLTKAATG